jgi:AraC-like DNA-binding protein
MVNPLFCYFWELYYNLPQTMELQFYTPESEILKDFIEGYYFIREEKIPKKIQYFTFPNNYKILSVNQSTTVHVERNRFIVSLSGDGKITSELVCSYTSPLEIIYEQAVNEVTIYFKPLGLNHFIDNTDIFSEKTVVNFFPFPDFRDTMKAIFEQPERKEQIRQLEHYLLSKLQKRDLSVIAQIVADVETGLKIEDIAEKHGLARQSIRRMFLKHVGKTPSEYRKIFRFRNAITEYGKSNNLTDLSYGNLFYDQSHFIKDFRTLTNTNPGSFFDNVDTEKGNVWLFV